MINLCLLRVDCGLMREPINTLQRSSQQVEDFGGTGPSRNAAASARGPTLLTKLFAGPRNFASGFFTAVLFIFSSRVPAISCNRDRDGL